MLFCPCSWPCRESRNIVLRRTCMYLVSDSGVYPTRKINKEYCIARDLARTSFSWGKSQQKKFGG